MMNVQTCTCGARIRLPDDAERRELRCPRCKRTLTQVGESVAVLTRAQESSSTGTCPICQTDVRAADSSLRCSSCEQLHHRDCWDEVGGCSTYGCDQAPELPKEQPSPYGPSTAWGDTKKCPVCGEEIKSIALRCRYCRTNFDTVDPLTARDVRSGLRKSENVQRLQQSIVTLFVLALIGCTAPIALIGCLASIVPKWHVVKKTSPLYQVLAYSALGLSVLYCVLMLVFGLAELGAD